MSTPRNPTAGDAPGTPEDTRDCGADIAAARALGEQLRCAFAAANAAPPSAWPGRDIQALDALRAVAAYLRMHANTDLARAITRTLTPTETEAETALARQASDAMLGRDNSGKDPA